MPMFEYKIIRDNTGKIDFIETNLSGYNLLRDPKLNKGCAFTADERELFNLNGLLPPLVETLDQQTARMFMQYKEHHTNLGKNIYLNMLHDYNETLFYNLASQHLEEMLPILYTPTVGEAVQRFSLEHRKPKGIYISYSQRDHIKKILDQCAPNEVDLCVVTDGEAVLGIGDQGIGGINISIAKLMVYTLCGGIDPNRTLPIQLDVGTNNPHLLNDPMYLGWRHERITGKPYDDFIEAFVDAITKKFPRIFLHWEDMGRGNARRILNHYREKLCTFNGDMQGTGAVALACILAGTKASGMPLSEHRIVIMGAGTAGTGIADQIYTAFIRDGFSDEQAKLHFWLVDKAGLLTKDMTLNPEQIGFARDPAELKQWNIQDKNYVSLTDVAINIKPTILIGCSTVAGAFKEEIVKHMAATVPRPIIMPLTNPNALSEAKPEDLIKWTQSKAIIATGSPFPEVYYEGKWHHVAQSNNAFIFPGIGLGSVMVKAKKVSNDMLWAATEALSKCSPIIEDATAPLLPKLSEARMVSLKVALAVAEQARAEGLAQIPNSIDLNKVLKNTHWAPAYYPYKKK
jgi:malate dehydrogenase (oxaloacetate-decarboxylating)